MSDSGAGASRISDEEVFRRELMMDGERTDDDRKIDALFTSFVQWFEAQGQRGEQIAAGYEKLMMQLNYLKLSSQRCAEHQRASTREIEELDKILIKMEKEVVEEKRSVAESQLGLRRAKKTRLNKAKYIHQDRLEQLERIEQDIKILMLKKEELQKDAEERENQFGLLLAANYEMKYKFIKELEEWENAVNH